MTKEEDEREGETEEEKRRREEGGEEKDQTLIPLRLSTEFGLAGKEVQREGQ